MFLRRYIIDSCRSTWNAQSGRREDDVKTHYFSTHGCKLGLTTCSFSFPDFFLAGARAWKKLVAIYEYCIRNVRDCVPDAFASCFCLFIPCTHVSRDRDLHHPAITETRVLGQRCRNCHPTKVCTLLYLAVGSGDSPFRVDEARDPSPLSGESVPSALREPVRLMTSQWNDKQNQMWISRTGKQYLGRSPCHSRK